MNPVSTQLEASADIEVPPRIWQTVVARAQAVSSQLWPEGSVALRVVDSAAIRQLNRDFRGVDSATDVLSFPSEGGHHIGDIALCWEAVEHQSQINGNNPGDEALALICHGMLHLAGFSHDDDAAEAEMTRQTGILCKSVGVEVQTFGH